MSASTYIHVLNDDVLLHIFTFNADMFCADYSYYFQRMEEWNPYSCHTPLRTARKTSQVCQKWRNLMLDTPSLWAKLINMHELYYLAGNEWWDEVIRRTGEAPLWIQVYSEGSPSKYIKRNLNFELQAFKFLENNWNRVQRLLVRADFQHLHPNVYIHSLLLLPAPQLQQILVTNALSKKKATGHDEHVDKEATLPLPPIFFADYAPMLRNFYFRGHVVDRRSLWLGHIFHIKLDGIYEFQNALSVLSVAQNIRTLDIDHIKVENPPIHYPLVTLSHLEHLNIHGFSQLCATVLDHLQIPLGCCLKISIVITSRYEFKDPKSAFCSVVDQFIGYVERYLPAYHFDVINLSYSSDSNGVFINFGTTSPDNYLISLGSEPNQYYSPAQPKILLQKLARLDLSRITKLTFYGGEISHASFASVFPPFFACLRSLHTVCIDGDTLCHLTMLDRYINNKIEKIIFPPSLQVIATADIDCYDHWTYVLGEGYLDFILSRVKNGCPITTLDLTSIDTAPLEDLSDLDVLEEIEGLTVLYKLSSKPGMVFQHACSGIKKVPNYNTRRRHGL